MKIVAASRTLCNGYQRYDNTEQDDPDQDDKAGRLVRLRQLQRHY